MKFKYKQTHRYKHRCIFASFASSFGETLMHHTNICKSNDTNTWLGFTHKRHQALYCTSGRPSDANWISIKSEKFEKTLYCTILVSTLVCRTERSRHLSLKFIVMRWKCWGQQQALLPPIHEHAVDTCSYANRMRAIMNGIGYGAPTAQMWSTHS